MDHQHLQDSSAGGEDRERSGGGSGSMRRRSNNTPSMRPPSATDNLRRISTERDGRPSGASPDRPNLAATPDDMTLNEDNFSFPANTRSYSWESQSDSEDNRGGGGGGNSSGRSSSRRDMRKFDMTTPTLIDEPDDEEEEMASYQRARQRQEERGFTLKDESVHRRTPGASMYKSCFQEEQYAATSLRRTPGAHDMHRSAIGTVGSGTGTSLSHQEPVGDESAVLGFGLTLSTPVAAGSSMAGDDSGDSWEVQSASSQLTPPRTNQSTAEAVAICHPSRPPRAPGGGVRPPDQQQQQERGVFTFTPWARQFDSRHGACSPNTLRLTEDLGNLLFDDEDSTDQSNQQVFRGVATAPKPSESGGSEGVNRELTSAESWTSSYVFKNDHLGDIPSRVPRSSTGRGRRGKNDSSSRRSRGHDRPVTSSISRATSDYQGQGHHGQQHQQQMASFLSNAQQPKPVPVRSMQHPPLGNPFLQGRVDTSTAGTYAPATSDNTEQQQPRFFNFGGAFAPPAKDTAGSFRPPVSASLSGEQPAGNRGILFTSMGQDQSQVQHFQSQSFQPLPSMAGRSRESPSQHPYPSPAPGYAQHASVSPAPPYGFPGSSQFLQSQGLMQPSANEFFPTTAPPLHQPRAPQYSPTQQRWPGAVPAQYGVPANQPLWPGSSAGWAPHPHPQPRVDYAYLHPPQPPPPSMDSRVVLSPAPPHVSPWPDHGRDFPSHASPSILGTTPPARLEASTSLSVTEAPSPGFTSHPPQNRRDQQQAQLSRQKNTRKSQTRRSSKQGKSDKAKKSDASATTPSATARKATPVDVSTTANAASSASNGRKKKQSKGRDSQTPEATGVASGCSTPSNVPTPAKAPGGEDSTLTVPEDPADLKRSELIESPATRSAFKDFYRRFRTEERSSFQGAEDFAVQSLGDASLPEKVHWRVYLELADLAKRSNRFADARRLYQQVCQLQPYASQGWLEYSKLEEECGHLNRGAKILRAGLEYCEYSENLLTRAIKHEEKMGNLGRARELLARLKHIGIEKVWRTVLEGALLEARAGNVVMARRVLKYLMHHVPWYGPLYLEAYRLERDLGWTSEALEVVERGLAAIPRYGPLWFGAFRLCEEIDIGEREFGLPRTMAMIDRATSSISKELIWKVHLDAAQMLERAALDLRAIMDESGEETLTRQYEATLLHCRKRFAMTILNCPPNLRWKVWLAAGRMEISVGNTDRARHLFLRAHQVVPDKGRATTLLECARLEEFSGDFELASAILCRSRVDYGSDWKVWLESVLLEIRGGHHIRAIDLAKEALEIHPGTGRLWAAFVQLSFFEGGEESQFLSLKRALNAVPKSGEVWCEGGRIHLNPFSRTFNLERTRRHLFFATKFTPQYGDSFLESLRLELLEQWVAPIATAVWESSKRYLLETETKDPYTQLVKYIHDLMSELTAICCGQERTVTSTQQRMLDSETVSYMSERLLPAHPECCVDLSDLELRCANADPNYGLLWFHSRHGPTDTARRILGRAKQKVIAELRKFVHIYIAAMVRHSAIMGILVVERDIEGESTISFPSIDDDAAWENLVDERLLAAPPLYDILHGVERNREKGVVFLENAIAASTFATGLVELNTHRPVGELSLNERRKALFGTDALFS